MHPEVRVHRCKQNEVQTSSIASVFDEKEHPLFSSVSLERGWMNNYPNISCYPIGEYWLVYEYSNKFKCMLWEIYGIERRSECKFHSANFWWQLNGCNALGLRFKDMNRDGFKDITYSKNTMQQFHQALKPYQNQRVKLIVTGKPGIF